MAGKDSSVTAAHEIILVKSGGEAAMPQWRRAFAELVPDLDVRWWDDASVDPDTVRYVLVWQPEPGRIAGYRIEVASSPGRWRLAATGTFNGDQTEQEVDFAPTHARWLRLIALSTSDGGNTVSTAELTPLQAPSSP